MEQSDIKVFYQYILNWLLPQDPSPVTQTMSSIAASVKTVVGASSSQTGRSGSVKSKIDVHLVLMDILGNSKLGITDAYVASSTGL